MKLKQAKLDWPAFNLWFPKNSKNNLLNAMQANGKVPELFSEAEAHTLM